MDTTLPEGTLLSDRFRVTRVLSQEGGMGVLYEALQESTGRRVALKQLRPAVLRNPLLRDAFVEEARAAAAITHPNVVFVLDRGEDPTHGPWLAAELLEGKNLAALLEARGPLSPAALRVVFRQLCAGIGAGHARGVVHCDLKPENIFVTNDAAAPAVWQVKVLDYGIARRIQWGKDVTAYEGVGSPCWMAPEQIGLAGNRVSAATDVWALGLIAFYALTGRHYQRTVYQEHAGPMAIRLELVLRRDELDPAPVRAKQHGFEGEVPAGFDAWFQRCIEREPSARFASAEAAFEALDVALGGTPMPEATPPAPPAPPPEAPLAETVVGAPAVPPTAHVTLAPAIAATRVAPPPTRRRSIALAGVAAVALALGLRTWRRQATMGCPRPAMVLVGGGDDAFCIDATEVRVAELRACLASGRCAAGRTGVRVPGEAEGASRDLAVWCNNDKPGRDEHPANCVDLATARAWCIAQGGDLPTDRQWLVAASGGRRRYPWGDEAPSSRRLNACGGECVRAIGAPKGLYDDDDGWAGTAPVGSFRAGDTPAGVHDLGGNVSEWVLGPVGRGALRGSAWNAGELFWVRAEALQELDPAARLPTVGFRCAAQPTGGSR